MTSRYPARPIPVQRNCHRLLPAPKRRGSKWISSSRPTSRAKRLESVLDGARAKRLPCRNVLDETLERNGSEIAMVEQAAGQPACPRRNHYRARLGQRLEPSGQVGGLANDRLFPGRSGTDEVDDRDKSGGDAGGSSARLPQRDKSG